MPKHVFILLISLMLIGCGGVEAEFIPPPPELDCSLRLSWQGIIPGESTREDVVRLLGAPVQKGVKKFEGERIPFYAYNLESGVVAEFVQDRIYFRRDGVVHWIEAIVADRDGFFYPAEETIRQLGTTLDTVYINTNYRPNSGQFDVVGGPDQLYVWAECGLALNTLIYCFASDEGELQCPKPSNPLNLIESVPISVRPRHPLPSSSGTVVPGDNNAVLMKFIFPPTTYTVFKEYYEYKIPFGLWEPSLKYQSPK